MTKDNKKWSSSCIGANDIESTGTKVLRQELQDEKKHSKALEKELTRKEKAHSLSLYIANVSIFPKITMSSIFSSIFKGQKPSFLSPIFAP